MFEITYYLLFILDPGGSEVMMEFAGGWVGDSQGRYDGQGGVCVCGYTIYSSSCFACYTPECVLVVEIQYVSCVLSVCVFIL